MPTGEEVQAFLAKRGVNAGVTVRPGGVDDTYIIVCSPGEAWTAHLALSVVSQAGRFVIYGKPDVYETWQEALKLAWSLFRKRMMEMKQCLVAYLRRLLLKKKG